ncbi:MAG: D-alanyl-D-alanine carboxypeptidase/D-alanyl-D-alanine-endopeptidase [Bacteroidia bacterium]|jgi:D-alanyl-D-alanine carboxypeptidase/D-alanyl-D-alanine-endopeptidase (penicillin-binding protein 4)
MKKKSVGILKWLLGMCILLMAITPARSQNDFEKAKETIKNHPLVNYGQVSWSFRDLQTGEELDAWQSQKLLTPASVQKAISTALVLDSLGPTYRFETQVGLDERIKNGRVLRYLVINSSGDPSLGSGIAGAVGADSVLKQISTALVNKGIREINGGIIICTGQDTSGYQAVPRSWSWEDIGNYYGAGAHGLNWRANEFTVEAFEKTNGDTIAGKIRVSKYASDLLITNNIKTNSGRESEINIFVNPLSNTVILDGELKAKTLAFSERGALPNPPLTFGKELQNHLEKTGIICASEINLTASLQDTLENLTSIFSPTLDQIVNETNQKSNNLFAECLGRKMGYGPFNLKSRSVLEQKALRYAGITDVPINFADASGLSRKNRINTAFLSHFLYKCSQKTWFDVYKNTLPLAGMEGTMKKFKKIENLRAKTGSLDGVKSYCGYITDKAGRSISFAIILNNVPLNGGEQKELAEKLLEGASKHKF